MAAGRRAGAARRGGAASKGAPRQGWREAPGQVGRVGEDSVGAVLWPSAPSTCDAVRELCVART